jgi:stage II sporulation protein D
MVSFLIPILFTTRFENKKTNSEPELTNAVMDNIVQNEVENQNLETSSINTYDYKEYNTIKLLHTATNQIEEVNIDEYLYGVVSAEIPASFDIEAIKAQAIVARTYTIYKIKNNDNKHGEAGLCDSSTCCQAWISKEDRLAKWEESQRQHYWDKIVSSVESTKGKVIKYNGDVICAFFHSNSGGMTEIPVNVWGGDEYPYLQAVQTSGEDAYSQYSSEVELTKQEVIDKIKSTHSDIVIDFSKQDEIKILEYTEGSRIKTIKFGNVNLSGVEARTIFGLRSTNFTVEIIGDKIKFKVIGYGHGVGMSQTGADALAKEGKNYEQIIKHYYTGVEVENY